MQAEAALRLGLIQELSTSMLSTLQRYYKQNGILSTSFTCKHKSECSSECATFTGPKSAYVSTGYEKGLLPRVLFLSLDSGSGDHSDEHRLPGAVRNQEEERTVLALAKHKHWFRTHELAWYILRPFQSTLKVEEAKNYFAHANSAKCCMNKPQRGKADSVLFRNCQEYLKRELEILDPAIVVTQGNESKKAILALLERQLKMIDEFSWVIRLNQKEIFWLHTYHPNNWGAFNRHRRFNKETGVAEGWVFYSERIAQFIKERDAVSARTISSMSDAGRL